MEGQGEESKIHFMKRAIELSRHAVKVGDGAPFGCVIVKDNQIIGEGWNHTKSQYDPTAHGEIDAIRNACRAMKTLSLEGTEIYCSCEPCLMCAAAIHIIGASKVYYAVSKSVVYSILGQPLKTIEEDLKNPTDQRKIPAQSLLSGEAQKVVEEWHQGKQ
ncbi:uncharacterized protein LOC106154581 [Lingula anatina]|uniref:Uncharacterized protein LOC106154581 n=1 Tax=Lingula anatina TaxID=7574 RepID=A0A1S3HG18_LINAN|nr:uncharacterized protein LOC106154581 [Lingula anatina]|eukprot:XP_013384426.1 uncharacterized protein LOC106154581 [Lingula anatina]